MVLSPRSLAYARGGLASLLRNSIQPVHLDLITDSVADKTLLADEMAGLCRTDCHSWSVYAKGDLTGYEADAFARYPNVRAFRNGHPCWRKITDPVLLSREGEEMVLLDPDLYFPNRFSFEPTPQRGLLLMWQEPNCLYPPSVVSTAMREGIPLARHVDIGVAQWRAPVDLEWLEWLLDKLVVEQLPRAMHIEAIIWSALAMRLGGGYLAPKQWCCWRRSQTKRVLHKLGVPGWCLLRSEPFSGMKCFHAGGQAKNWVAQATERGWMDAGNLLDQPCQIRPFVELTPHLYQREQRVKHWLRRVGYYRVFQSAWQ